MCFLNAVLQKISSKYILIHNHEIYNVYTEVLNTIKYVQIKFYTT